MRWLIPASCLMACNGLAPITDPDVDTLEPAARAQVELGRKLFFDEGLSGVGDVSCASCHDPEQFGADGRATSTGTQGAVLRRNAPSVFNAALKQLQFWDGRATTLEEQALGPLLAKDEMGATEAGLQAYLEADWTAAFAGAFPDEPGPTIDQLTRALAAYQRMLPTPSAFDRFLLGETEALSPAAQRGFAQFRNDCAFCHSGPGVGGGQLERLGDERPWPQDRSADLGRFEVTQNPQDRLVFVVPSLRNVAETGPWFHDGSVSTLEEAVRLMGRHQLDEELPDGQVNDLVAFLESLTAEQIPAWAYDPEFTETDSGAD